MRLLYRSWRPTRLGRWVNRLACWWSGLGLPPRFQAVLEVNGRASGRRRANPVVIVSLEGQRYLVSMLGPGSDWVKNVRAVGSTSHFPPAHLCPTSRGSPDTIRSTGSIPHESDSPRKLRMPTFR